MSIVRMVDLRCDGDNCAHWIEGGSTPPIARQLARHYGWVYTDGLDLCGSCADRRAVQAAIQRAQTRPDGEPR